MSRDKIAARQKCFVSQLSRNCPYRGGSCERGKKSLLLWARDSLGGILGDNLGEGTNSEKVFECQERVSGFPEKGADLRGSAGNFRGSLGNFRGTSGLLPSSTVRELPKKSPKNFWGSSGNFRGSPGTSQKLGGA